MRKKIFIPGLLSGTIMLLVGMALSQGFTAIFPSLMTEYEDTYLFRSWSDPFMMLYFAHPFITGFILAWIWDRSRSFFPGSVQWKKGLQFGAIYSLISLSGLIMTFSSFPVSTLMLASWTASVIIQAMITGVILARLNP